MPAPKWLAVARNQYRVTTSSIRMIRPYFAYLVIGLLAAYLFFIAPAVVGLFIDDFIAFILSQAAVPLVQIILFMIFFYFIIFPLANTLKDVQAGRLEIFLAAPIKPSDVLLGEFVGAMPFYAIAVTVITGLFTALLAPLGLDVVQTAITIAVFVITFLSASWIGAVITALLRTKLGRTARGKDIGKALSLIIGLPMIGIMYAIIGGGLLEALADPGTGGTVKAVLGLLPSSWGAEVFVGFASNPGNIAATAFETLSRFGGLIVFFVAMLWLGSKAADRAYSLETATFTASRAKPDGAFYRAIKYLGGGKAFGTLLVSVFKDYGRRLENLSKIAYIVGLLILINVFLGGPDAPEGVLIFASFLFPMLAVFVVGEVTLRGKETLFIYKKTPSGVGRLVKARFLQGWLVVVPIAAAITAVSTVLISQVTFVDLLINTGFAVLFSTANVAFALGLSLLNPAFSTKSGNFMLNVMIVAQGSVFLFIIPLIVLRSMESAMLLLVAVSWLLGIVFLYLGKRRLSRME